MKKPDLQNLLQILRMTGGKYIFIEDGKPTAVLMDYEEFENLVTPGIVDRLIDKMSDIEQVNKEVTKAQLKDLREEVISPDFESIIQDSDPDDAEITIEPIERF